MSKQEIIAAIQRWLERVETYREAKRWKPSDNRYQRNMILEDSEFTIDRDRWRFHFFVSHNGKTSAYYSVTCNGKKQTRQQVTDFLQSLVKSSV